MRKKIREKYKIIKRITPEDQHSNRSSRRRELRNQKEDTFLKLLKRNFP